MLRNNVTMSHFRACGMCVCYRLLRAAAPCLLFSGQDLRIPVFFYNFVGETFYLTQGLEYAKRHERVQRAMTEQEPVENEAVL